jgi:hypothetical protein
VKLGGTGIASTLSLSQSTWSFASQHIGVTSPNATITISNTGTAPVALNSISISDPGPGVNFSLVSKTCNASLPGSSSCTITFNFTPRSGGLHQALIELNTSSSKHAIEIPLRGYGTM